jgi:hypothetical protein
MHKNLCILVGTLDAVDTRIVEDKKIIYFTVMCRREDSTEFDKVECKVCGRNAEIFERINIPGNELTVMGKLTTKEYSDGTLRTGVCVAHLSEGDLFDVSDESDSCRLRRIAKMYDDNIEEEFTGWTDEMLEEWDHANREERAYMRGKYGAPPRRRGNT